MRGGAAAYAATLSVVAVLACESERKSIPRDKVEDGFAEILKSLQPTRTVFTVAKAMFKDAWNMRLNQAHREKEDIARQLRDAEKQIEPLLERVVEADNASGIKAYEGKIAKLEREKLLLAE